MHTSISRFMQLTPLISALCLTGLPIAQANAAGDRLSDSAIDTMLEGMEAQSPIDIRSDNTYFGRLSPLGFNLSSSTDLEVSIPARRVRKARSGPMLTQGQDR